MDLGHFIHSNLINKFMKSFFFMNLFLFECLSVFWYGGGIMSQFYLEFFFSFFSFYICFTEKSLSGMALA